MSDYFKYLFLHLAVHLALAVPWALWCRREYGNRALIWVLLGTIAIDFDHLAPLLTFSLTQAWSYLQEFNLYGGQRAPFLPLHAFELALGLVLLGRLQRRFEAALVPLGGALGVHLLFDLGVYSLTGQHPLYYTYLGWILGVAQNVWIHLH